MKKLISLLSLYIFLSIPLYAQEQEEIIPLEYDTSEYLENTSTHSRISSFSTSSEVVPTIKSEMDVNNSGALIYTLPIEVHQGINNFQPNITLSYNSQSGNGQAGWGWNVIGISIITQGGKNKSTDGITQGVQFTDSDPWYLDGQRLISMGNNLYETEVFSKLKIKKLTNGEYSFVVQYPDGKIGKYKSTVNGQHYISTFTDALGNEIHYTYEIISNIPYIKRISYGGTTPNTDTYQIDFLFKNRKYPSLSYRNGIEYISSRILSQIQVSSTYDGLYRTYLLTHDLLSNKNERLRKIEIENGKGEKLKPLSFGYNTSNSAEISLKSNTNNGFSLSAKKLGSVAIGDFKGTNTPYSIYNMEENDGKYKLSESSVHSDKNTLLFSGKALFADNKITQNDQLFIINTEFVTTSDNKTDFYTEHIPNGTLVAGIPINNKLDYGNELLRPSYLTLHTPKIKVNISVYDPVTQKRKNVYFYAKGNYFGNVEDLCRYDSFGTTKTNLICEETPSSIGEKNIPSKDLGSKRIVVADLNNDGLTDILIQNKPSSCSNKNGGAFKKYNEHGAPSGLYYTNQCYERESTFYFIEIGKLQQEGEISPEIFTSEVPHLGTPVEFDGDGIPELIYLANDQFAYEREKSAVTIEVLKVNTLQKSLKKVILNREELLTFNQYKEPVFYGDFNGDGLTDFIIPRKIFEITQSQTSQKVMEQIDSSSLIWDLYTNTGKEFLRKEMDLTSEKIAYLKPSQRDVIKKSSLWQKFWSGKPDEYQYGEYGTSHIILTDINNDGKTDLISIRKFTKMSPGTTGYLNSLKTENLNLSSVNADKITILETKTDTDHTLSFSKLKDISIKDRTVSSFALILGNTDYNQLNTYKSGITIHDLATKNNLHLNINNDNFTETHLKKIDNGSGVIQTVQYRPMVSENSVNTSEDRIYTLAPLSLTYPYYIHSNQGTHYLVHKLNTLFDGKALTTEYRYENGVQHLEGKGFLGFEKTFVSDPYESLPDPRSVETQYINQPISNSQQDISGNNQIIASSSLTQSTVTFRAQQIRLTPGFRANAKENVVFRAYVDENISPTQQNYYKKELFRDPVFWKVNRFNPTLDNALVESTYGSLDRKNVFTLTYLTYKKYDKGSHRYLILPIYEENMDQLKNITAYKDYTYDPGTLFLTGTHTSFDDEYDYIHTSHFDYQPDFYNGEHYFSGKIIRTEESQYRKGSSFSTKEESDYLPNGLVSQSRKYGNNTPPVVTQYTYDSFGNILSQTVSSTQTDTAPLTVQYEYDPTHRYVVKTTSPEGLISTQNISTLGLLISETSSLGHTTKYEYDSWNNPVKTTDYLGISTTYSKKPRHGNYELIVQREGEAPMVSIFDKFDRKVRTETSSFDELIATDIQYDLFGRVIKTSEPYFDGDVPVWNTFEYDELNRPVKQTSYTGRVATTCYEKRKVTVEDGHKKTSKLFDVMGNLVEHRDSGGVIRYDYYPNGVLKAADYEGIVMTMKQDGWGNRTELVDPSAGTYLYEYDNLGKLLTETTPKGKTSYFYDSYGKIIREKTEGDHTRIEKNYQYDPATQLILQIAGTSNGKSYTYDTFYDTHYRIKGKKETTPYLVSQTETVFDSHGRPELNTTQILIPETGYRTTNQIQNVYNSDGVLIQQRDLTDQNRLIWELKDVNARNMVTQMQYGNGYQLYTEYDSRFTLKNIRHTRGNLTAVNTRYQYDIQKGVLTNRNNLVFFTNETFTYDGLDRLLTESVNNQVIQEYTYDPRGRMTYNSQVGEYVYPEHNYQLNQIRFNSRGLELQQNRGFHQITYNAFKNPKEIFLPGKDRMYYEYGILNNRSAVFYGDTTENSAGKPKRKYYSSDGMIEVSKEGNQYQIITYIDGDAYSATKIRIEKTSQSTRVSDARYFLHRDNQQSIIAITHAENGNLTEQRLFDAWGNLTEVRKTTNGGGTLIQTSGFSLLIDRGYTGHEHLLTVGLIHMNGRLYDPSLRRFLSPDNFVQEPDNTQNYNRYGYVLNNPLLYTDPSGESFWGAVAIGAAVAIVTNSINNMINGVPFWYGTGKSTTIGAVSGAISFGIGEAVSGLSGMNKALLQAGMHGLSGGIMSSAEGGNFGSGFASGAISSLISSGISTFSTNSSGNLTKFGKSGYYKAVTITAGGLSGGISSSIAGGNFWTGARQGVITSGLNHLAHYAKGEIQKSTLRRQVEKAYGIQGAENPAKKDIYYIKSMVEKIPSLRKIGGIGRFFTKYNILNESGYDTYARTGADLIVHFYDEAFSSNLILATVIGHELVHVNEHLFGIIKSYESSYGYHGGQETIFSHHMSETSAWKWTFENAYDIFPDAYNRMNNEYIDAKEVWNYFNSGKRMPQIQKIN